MSKNAKVRINRSLLNNPEEIQKLLKKGREVRKVVEGRMDLVRTIPRNILNQRLG